MLKTCKHCEKRFESTRIDQKYCSAGCKQMAYRSRNGKAIELFESKKEKGLSGLSFVQSEKSKTLSETFQDFKNTTRSYNPVLITLKSKIRGLKQEREVKERERVSLINQLHNLINSDPVLSTRLALIALGGGAGYATGDKKEKTETTIAGGVIGWALHELFVNKEELKKNKQTQINALQNQITALQGAISWLDVQLTHLENDLLKTPKIIEKETFDFIEKMKFVEQPKEIVRIELPKLREKVPVLNTVSNEKQTFSQPISTEELIKKSFQTWNFNDPWLSFLGEPETRFSYLIYGKPGQGKSTFALKFAYYLASEKGKVIYNSSEEGVSKTLVDNLKRLSAANQYFLVTQCKTLDELTAMLKQNPSPFVFIDSANNMNIKAQDIETLKKMFPKNSFIVINQSTKEGLLRGSQEFNHNADTVIKIENGVAQTEKNRYGKNGETFKIW